jgi:hypothetical protein
VTPVLYSDDSTHNITALRDFRPVNVRYGSSTTEPVPAKYPLCLLAPKAIVGSMRRTVFTFSADGNNNISPGQPRTFRFKVTAKL